MRDLERNRRDLALTLAVTATYCVVEAAGGILTNSLALLSDAGHMFADVAALGLSLFAIRLAQRPPTSSKTFGYHRVEILAVQADRAGAVPGRVDHLERDPGHLEDAAVLHLDVRVCLPVHLAPGQPVGGVQRDRRLVPLRHLQRGAGMTSMPVRADHRDHLPVAHRAEP